MNLRHAKHVEHGELHAILTDNVSYGFRKIHQKRIPPWEKRNLTVSLILKGAFCTAAYTSQQIACEAPKLPQSWQHYEHDELGFRHRIEFTVARCNKLPGQHSIT